MSPPAPSRRGRRCRHALAVLVAVALAAVLAGCGVDLPGSSLPGPSKDRLGSTTTAPANAGSLQWRSCDGGFQCATLRVPVDYAKPDGGTLELGVARLPAADPSRRIGSLLVNPGGPGASAIDFMEAVPFPRELADRFDIVAFDPRGVGRSTPLQCHRTLQEMYDADPTIEDQADADHLLAVSKTFVDGCKFRYADLLPHLGTMDVARDMDRVREALGDPKLTYLGYSYGTSIGQQYAGLFPTRVRAMVLDGVVDPDQTGLQAATGQAVGFENALQHFLDDCAARPSCPLQPNPRAVLDRVRAATEATPIPSAAADRPATPGVFDLAVASALYARQSWPVLAQALASADAGDGSGLVDLADEYLQRNPDGTYPSGFEDYFAVSCLDSTWPTDPAEVLAAGKEAAKVAPETGEALVNDYVRCALWPTPPEPLHGVTADGSPPILVLSTTGDPATPYENGVKVADRLANGVLLTNNGEGHTVFLQGKPCVDDKVIAYLVDLQVPPDGTTC